MPEPLENSLDEHAFDGEFAALPRSHDPLADLERGRRLQRAQRRHRAVALGCVAAALATTGLVLAPSIGAQTGVPAGPVPTASARPAATTRPGGEPQNGPCIGTVQLVGAVGDPVLLTPNSTPTIRLRVGDLLRLEADGRCGSAVVLSSQNDSVLRVVDAQTVRAIGVGSTRLGAGHAMCAGLPPATRPGCIGGVARDGQADVVVVPS